MEKNVISIGLDKFNEREQEEYVMDMVDAVHAYIKSDCESSILRNFATHTEDIRRLYDEKVYGEELKEQFAKLYKRLETYSDKTHGKKEQDDNLSQVLSDMQSDMERYIHSILVYSQLNVLRELHEKEEKKRRDEKEFQYISSENPKLIEIALEVEKKRRMRYVDIKAKFKLSDADMHGILSAGQHYFNLSKDRNHKIINISLKPKGKQYIHYICESKMMVSQTKVNEIVASNCESMLISLRTSLIKKIPYDMEVMGVSPATKRKMLYNYRQNISEMIKITSDKYEYNLVNINQNFGGGVRYGIKKDNALI